MLILAQLPLSAFLLYKREAVQHLAGEYAAKSQQHAWSRYLHNLPRRVRRLREHILGNYPESPGDTHIPASPSGKDRSFRIWIAALSVSGTSAGRSCLRIPWSQTGS